MRKTTGYAFTDYKTNTEIEKDLNITRFWKKIQEYNINWLQYINRIPHNRYPRILTN
jgi:hypothetical protein